MLQINPHFRPTASELLKSSYFDDIRITVNEEKASKKIRLKIDEDGKARNFTAESSPDIKLDKEILTKIVIESHKLKN